MNTSEVLNRAADLIEERGWTKGRGWVDDGGPLCLEGGIAAALGVEFTVAWRCPAYAAVREYLAPRTDKAPFIWNDRLAYDYINEAISRREGWRDMAATTAEGEAYAKGEVIAVLRAAALVEAAKENNETSSELGVA